MFPGTISNCWHAYKYMLDNSLFVGFEGIRLRGLPALFKLYSMMKSMSFRVLCSKVANNNCLNIF